MHLTTKISQLNRATLLFPLALVLFEFAVYIANDMAQPAMLLVTQEFGVEASWVPVSMTAFILGGAALSWLTGPLSDRIGRRPVMLFGVLYFIFSCLATYAVHTIESYMVLRMLQGAGLSLIAAVGYAAVQESFDEITAVKVTALMANVALLAPMVGPLAGAALIQFAPWRSCFLLIAAISFIALLGLWKKMPETVSPHTVKEPFSRIVHDYIALYSQSRFVLSVLTLTLIGLPLIGWIALSPVLIVNDFNLSLLDYGLWQLPILGSLVLGNLSLIRIADRWPLGRSVLVGCWPMLIGMLFSLASTINSPYSLILLITGISFIAFAEGLTMAVLYRFTLMSSTLTKGTVSAGMAVFSLGSYALGIEFMRLAYIAWHVTGFTLSLVVICGCFILMVRPRVRHEMQMRASAMMTD